MELPHKLILATFIDGVKCNSINSKKPKEAKSYKVQVISFEKWVRIVFDKLNN